MMSFLGIHAAASTHCETGGAEAMRLTAGRVVLAEECASRAMTCARLGKATKGGLVTYMCVSIAIGNGKGTRCA